MTDYEAAMAPSGWSGCCPIGWSWMLEAGSGEPVLCWYLPSPNAAPADGIVAFDGLTARARTPLGAAMQAGNLWRRYTVGVKPNAGPV